MVDLQLPVHAPRRCLELRPRSDLFHRRWHRSKTRARLWMQLLPLEDEEHLVAGNPEAAPYAEALAEAEPGPVALILRPQFERHRRLLISL